MALTMTPRVDWLDYSVEVDQILATFFEERIQQARAVSPYYEALWQEMYRLVQSGGKRLRPKLTILAYGAFGGNNTVSILPIAAAQELLHVSMLIHDDVIDRDYIRYGVDNVAGRYKKVYEQFVPDAAERTHYAHSAALLGGDLLISGSYELITHSRISPSQQTHVQQVLARSIFEVAGGELLDTESPFRPLGVIPAITVAQYKTASYSFVGPLVIGAMLAGASEDSVANLRQFAENIGIAFQLRDDIIGVFGDEARTGKSSIGDIREGKRTYMVEQFMLMASADQKAEFEQYFGKADVTAEGVELVRQLFDATGARQRTDQAIDAYEAQARQALSQLTLLDGFEGRLEEVITLATRRDH